MSKITISREEYVRLKRQSEAYKNLAGRFFETAVKDPITNVVKDFRRTGLYTREFLSDLEKGLRKSSYSSK
ncbi:MAG: hypothetical protein A2832_00615 [Candidatus Zambryskibacteria bacterium RIFCSPHIGHO2_01_FULL_44_22b]|uniref:Uncharacterized protein n=2 Tax=Candidatus Zambryskiibacteriota TaxID=1817925 RepID=A0A1G2T3V6_9BACT|nr:MAG: hypothetical protein A2832_00615 [Candidatus Zambryskibacteria bacterium RIFCSPHIGHO2_01_FULL_44_22b]OHB06389.1 MAG: hypothetical protein A3B16_00290 [Candidatus Zambryskibacteria bacterium RIFCSPLOWO2_01_FULL_45_43]